MEKIGNEPFHAIVSSKGAMVKQLVYYGDEIIFPERPVGEKSRGGIPICFPFFGKPERRFDSLPQHGWLRHQELRLEEKTDYGVVFSGENEPVKDYPWKLSYRIAISIGRDFSLTIRLATKRMEDGEYFHAPINPGFHPYFMCSDPSPTYLARCIARVGSRVITDFQRQHHKISVDDPILIQAGENKVRMNLGGNFNGNSCLTLWTDDDSQYFCVEPILSEPIAFDESDGGKFLAEGEEAELIMTLCIAE